MFCSVASTDAGARGQAAGPKKVARVLLDTVHGKAVTLSVGHDANTTLHLAELMASVPYRTPGYCTVLQNGRVTQFHYGENDHCCARFALADEWLRDRKLQSEGQVGHAHARLAASRDIVAVALEHLALDPLLFLHPASAGCDECDLARQSVPAAPDWAARIKNTG